VPHLATAFAVVAGTLVVGCSSLPPLTVPQLQAVSQIGEYGTDRLRVSDACRAASTTVEGYVQCVQEKGWKFIGRGNIYPAPECWSARSTGDPRQMPAAQCFVRATAPGLTASPPPPAPAP
jgi:hypothetical protein